MGGTVVDDLAPAPAQRTSDDAGQRAEESFAARKRLAKKGKPPPAPPETLEPDPVPEPESEHQLDVLA